MRERDFFLPPEAKADTVRRFVDSLDDGERESADELASELLLDGPLASCVVIIPVAAHQESQHIHHTVSEYARQDTSEPFTVIMFMNTSEGPNDAGVQATEAEFQRAKADFPNLDLCAGSTQPA